MPELALTVQDYVDRYVAEGQRLLRGGVEPAAPAAQYVAAYPALRAFLRQHGEVLAARGVVSAEVEAGEVLVAQLAEQLRAGPASHVGAEDLVCQRAALRLRQLRDVVRRVLRGPETAALRARLGLERPLRAHSVTCVLRNLEQFLGGLREHPEQLPALRLIPADLEELEELRQRLQHLRRTSPPGDPQQLLSAHLAVEACFASLAAAISAAFPPQDPRRIAGLKLIPRAEERRQRRPAPKLWRAAHPSPDD